jgi:DNA-binding NtrC family response regulator
MPRSRNVCVLVVGADPLAREQIVKPLRAERVAIVESSTFKEARALSRRVRFDAVVCAAELPDGSGLLLLDDIHAWTPTAALLVAAPGNGPDLFGRTYVYGFIELPATACVVQSMVRLAIDEAHLSETARQLPALRLVSA